MDFTQALIGDEVKLPSRVIIHEDILWRRPHITHLKHEVLEGRMQSTAEVTWHYRVVERRPNHHARIFVESETLDLEELELADPTCPACGCCRE